MKSNKKPPLWGAVFFVVEMPGIGPGSGETLGYKCLVRDSIFLLNPGKLIGKLNPDASYKGCRFKQPAEDAALAYPGWLILR